MWHLIRRQWKDTGTSNRSWATVVRAQKVKLPKWLVWTMSPSLGMVDHCQTNEFWTNVKKGLSTMSTTWRCVSAHPIWKCNHVFLVAKGIADLYWVPGSLRVVLRCLKYATNGAAELLYFEVTARWSCQRQRSTSRRMQLHVMWAQCGKAHFGNSSRNSGSKEFVRILIFTIIHKKTIVKVRKPLWNGCFDIWSWKQHINIHKPQK